MKIIKIKTAKGRDGVEVNRYRYRKDNTLVNGEINWRCTSRNCSVSLKTNSAVTTIRQAPTIHDHEPPDVHILSSPSVSEPSTPTSQTPTVQTPTSDDLSLQETDKLSLTELISPYITLTPEPPRFPQLSEENSYLRQRVAELNYMNQALTDKLIDVEKKLLSFEETPHTPILVEESNVGPPDKLDDDNKKDKNKETGEKMPDKTTTESQNKIETEENTRNLTKIDSSKFSFLKGIHVLEADMGVMIDLLKHNKSVAFAHSISSDFESHRHMSAGVAVVFRNKFKKPQKEDCLTKNLAYQKVQGGASVYSLITKPAYYEKPTDEEYDTAFGDFQKEFKEKGFSTLICSAIGCVRDEFRLDHFARKITQLHHATGASILIVTKDHRTSIQLKRGLSQSEFTKQLRKKIANAQKYVFGEEAKREHHDEHEKRSDPPLTAADWYMLQDEELKLYLDQITVPDNARVLDITVSHFLKINKDSQDTEKMRRSLALENYDYVLAIVNDREKEEKEGGTHWSLLLYIRDSDSYYHLDSLEPRNRVHAQRLAAALGGDPDVNVVQLQCRQQDKSVECGVYAAHFAEIICSEVMSSMSIPGNRCFMQEFSINNIYAKIKQMKNKRIGKQKISKESDKTKTDERSKLVKKVTLLSDSHGRDLRHLLQNELSESKVYSVVKPNGKLEHVASDLDYEVLKLRNNDHLIVLSGSNNVDSSTEFKVKSYVKEIADKTKHTNVIICTIPMRHDKPQLNIKIRKINIELIIESLKYDHLKVVSLANISTKDYTSRGLHLNQQGKRNVSKLLANKISEEYLN